MSRTVSTVRQNSSKLLTVSNKKVLSEIVNIYKLKIATFLYQNWINDKYKVGYDFFIGTKLYNKVELDILQRNLLCREQTRTELPYSFKKFYSLLNRMRKCMQR